MSDEAEGRFVDFAGEEFRAADKVGAMALMRFAHVAKGGADSNDLEGLAAMYDLLEQCIHPDEWARFQEKALEIRADGDDLMKVSRQVITGRTHRPTGRPSDSSDGPQTTEPSSEGVSSSPEEPGYLRVARHWEEKGRPDVAYMVQMAQEKATSAA